MSIPGWPGDGDRPYIPTDPARIMPHMSWARQRSHAAHLYVLGYRRAAERIQAEVEHRGSEMLVFPMLFLWRQHLELFIKLLIDQGHAVHELEGEPPFGHELPKLWAKLRALLEKEEVDASIAEAMKATEHVLEDLEAVDPNSTHSRYAEGHSGDRGYLVKSLHKLPDHFDPRHFGEIVTSVSDFFDCIHAEYVNRLDALTEMATVR
jgi:hypothetical protein